MPYKLRKINGKYCVMNEDTGENKGCSKSRAMGIRHMRAMYAAEGSSKMGKKELEDLVTKSLASFSADNDGEQITPDDIEKSWDGWGEYITSFPYTPYGITTYAALEAWRTSEDKLDAINDEVKDFQSLVNNIVTSSDIPDKAAAVADLATEFSNRIKNAKPEEDEKACADCEDQKSIGTPAESLASHIIKMVKDGIDEVINIAKGRNDNGNEVMIWKSNDGQYNWIGRFSSKFRDRDNPPEIISSAAHRTFAEKTEKGLVDLPVLEIWHNKDWEIGKATWVAYDDSGFPLAGGYFYPEAYPIAENLKEVPAIAMSHGMPVDSIKRDPNDPTVITEYVSKEVSILPPFAAANEMAEFYVQKEADMPIEKRAKIIESKFATEEQLAAIEERNRSDADKAKAEGIQSKEKAEEPAATPAAEQAAPVAPAVETPVAPAETVFDARTAIAQVREDLAASLAAIKKIADRQEQLEGEFSDVGKALKELGDGLNSRARRFVPSASLDAVFAQSAVGNKAAELTKKETSDLMAGRPKEAPAQAAQKTGVPFIDRILADEAVKKAQAQN